MRGFHETFSPKRATTYIKNLEILQEIIIAYSYYFGSISLQIYIFNYSFRSISFYRTLSIFVKIFAKYFNEQTRVK